MAAVEPPEPPFDPGWLEDLAVACAALAGGTPQLEDLFLERRLELRVTMTGSMHRVEECRTDGTAVRWRFLNRSVLHACSGASTPAVIDLLSSHADRAALPSTRRLPPIEIDPPRGWQDWAVAVAGRVDGDRAVVRFLSRRAAVVRPRHWAVVGSPPLVRVEVEGHVSAALLAVWDHPDLNRWLLELSEPVPSRAWQPSSGTKVPVLLSAGTAGILFHELVGHPVESDFVLSGESPLASLGGTTVTAATVQISDDPSRFDLPGAFSCDDEGVPGRPQSVVDDGRLVGWLCDREGCDRLDAVAGRGRRASWGHRPSARLSNLVVAPGDTDPDALERDLRRGLLVTRLGGATVDPVSHRVVLRVERGWEIHHGRRRRPLAGFELTGRALEVVANIDPSLGSDPTTDWRLGWCVKDGVPLPTGSESPSVLVHRLEVL
jgi:hypothetical protein